MSTNGQYQTPLYWTVREVSEYWSVSLRKVYRDIEHGRLPVVEVGGLIRVHDAAAKAYGKQLRPKYEDFIRTG